MRQPAAWPIQRDLPILVATLREGCPWLVTFNVRHYRPGHPGGLLLRVRDRLARLPAEGEPWSAAA